MDESSRAGNQLDSSSRFYWTPICNRQTEIDTQVQAMTLCPSVCVCLSISVCLLQIGVQ